MTRPVKKRRTITGHEVTAQEDDERNVSSKRKVTAQPTRRSKRLAEKQRRREAEQQQQNETESHNRRRRLSAQQELDDCSVSSLGSSSSESSQSESSTSLGSCDEPQISNYMPYSNLSYMRGSGRIPPSNKKSNPIPKSGGSSLQRRVTQTSFNSNGNINPQPIFRAPPAPIVPPAIPTAPRKKKTKEYREIVEISSDSDSPRAGGDDMAIDSDESTPGPQYMCDEKGYIVLREGLKINNRFRLIRQLGKGTFSRVFEATDKKEGRKRKALKVIRAVDKYRAAARTELRVLTTIRDNDPEHKRCCVRLLEDTYYNEHPIFVFNLLGRSLYSFLVDNNYHAYKLEHVRHFAQQIIHAVAYVHSLQIIITDLKPENIVFVDDRSVQEVDETGRKFNVPLDTRIRLIDFGSAVFDNTGVHTHLIQTRHYRAPEVVLQSNWSYSADIWSIGCILVELIVGRMLFNTHDSIDHLSQMEKCLGQRVPPHITENLPDEQWHQFFMGDGYEENIIATGRAKRSPFQCTRLPSYFSPSQHQLQALVEEMLKWDPEERVTAKDAQFHPFLTGQSRNAFSNGRTAEYSSSRNLSNYQASRRAYPTMTNSNARSAPTNGASRRMGLPAFVAS